MLVVSFIGLGYLGALPVTEERKFFSRVFSLGYFGFFLGLWWISKNEKTRPVPERVK
jgi:ubiquinol-cytochrome c reductase cytochrome b subunit